MERSVMICLEIPIEIEAETVEEAERIRAKFVKWLAQSPRMLMAKGKWKIKRGNTK